MPQKHSDSQKKPNYLHAPPSTLKHHHPPTRCDASEAGCQVGMLMVYKVYSKSNTAAMYHKRCTGLRVPGGTKCGRPKHCLPVQRSGLHTTCCPPRACFVWWTLSIETISELFPLGCGLFGNCLNTVFARVTLQSANADVSVTAAKRS